MGCSECGWIARMEQANRRRRGDKIRPRRNKEMRISFSLPLYAATEDLTLRRQHSRFTSAWRRGNTESMSVLWNVLSCRAASFPIFRSTSSLVRLVRDLCPRTIVSYILIVIPSRFITSAILSPRCASITSWEWHIFF